MRKEDVFAFDHTRLNEMLDDLRPITQEFIESFGFELSSFKGFGCLTYEKELSKNETLFLVSYDNKYSLHEGVKSINPVWPFNFTPVFSDYNVSTRAELRFLLTKGRIDCSK